MGILDLFKRKKQGSNVVIKPVLKINADAEANINITPRRARKRVTKRKRTVSKRKPAKRKTTRKTTRRRK